MTFAGRTLSPAVVEALRYWPGVVHEVTPAPVDLAVLPPFFDELLAELPWWNRAWRITQVEPAYPRETPWNEGRQGVVEVSVPGTASCGVADTLPFSARVRFEHDRMIRFQAKLGDVVVGPSIAATGQPEPHPFGIVFSRLMDLRGISVREMARGSFRSYSTIRALRSGHFNPHRDVLAYVPEVLKMSAEDLAAIAGLDPEDTR
ncbi:helix-turn-helix domain-containing protein [Plantactinospora endophytica]|uniref:XRE family transcriptional regulator n=1 Tax=Plantactinospora endophytica TaxID=673535 RepID=A0ABQ4DX73_9ACTN|nr:helix-turn-helix transcriptional regulator [Plantactinospora endophytica]GIG87073.1 hypothetical protein Pen02_20090 [Plantactinospora endophytica]